MKLAISASVGKGGSNSQKDTKVIQALLNVYLRSINKEILKIDGKPGGNTNAAIGDYQKAVLKSLSPDGRVDPHGRTFRSLVATYNNSLNEHKSIIKPSIGIVTFDAEGMEGGPYHSRILHVPGAWSGLTIGRGYDMGMKTSSKISRDLLAAGISATFVAKLKMASKLKGELAKQFIINNDLLDFQITPEQQKSLFLLTYADEEAKAKSACNRTAVVNEYGKCDWEKLNSKIKQLVVDLKFRGDYTTRSRKFLQPHIVSNDLDKFKKEMIDVNNWQSVPKDRFNRRKAFFDK